MTVGREISQSHCETVMRSREAPRSTWTVRRGGRVASLPAEGSSQQRIRDCSRSLHE